MKTWQSTWFNFTSTPTRWHSLKICWNFNLFDHQIKRKGKQRKWWNNIFVICNVIRAIKGEMIQSVCMWSGAHHVTWLMLNQPSGVFLGNLSYHCRGMISPSHDQITLRKHSLWKDNIHMGLSFRQHIRSAQSFWHRNTTSGRDWWPHTNSIMRLDQQQ